MVVPINQIGICPLNRGRLGVSAFHVHDIVRSVLSDGLSRARYRECTIVEVPDRSWLRTYVSVMRQCIGHTYVRNACNGSCSSLGSQTCVCTCEGTSARTYVRTFVRVRAAQSVLSISLH